MKILAVADHEAKYFYDYYTPGRLSEFDLILSCGDLRREYLDDIKASLRAQLNNTSIQEPDGTIHKLAKKD